MMHWSERRIIINDDNDITTHNDTDERPTFPHRLAAGFCFPTSKLTIRTLKVTIN